MNAQEFEVYLHTHIPITSSMGIRVVSYTPDDVRLRAELSPNINHLGTAFGGSISSLLITTAWAGVQLGINSLDVEADILVQRSEVNYQEPIRGSFTASLLSPAREDWLLFKRTFEKFGLARITVHGVIQEQGLSLADFEGVYVAIRKS
ncbi:MAG: YiiD C-terminal domain-containing protein [Bacteroidota bacterium]